MYTCNASLFNIPIHVPGVHHCQKYASASHQVPANQKSIQLLLSRKCTHCYQHSTKERLNYGQQSFETCIYITTSILMKHRIIIRYLITVLIDCQIDMYHRSLVCACAMYAHARACICVCVWIRLCIAVVCTEWFTFF